MLNRVLQSRIPPLGFVLMAAWSVHVFLGEFWCFCVRSHEVFSIDLQLLQGDENLVESDGV